MRPALPLGAAAAAGACWGARTHATWDERRRPLPGDALVPDPMWGATRAITIEAPREAVWPWIVQMGFPTHRAGWYTPYWLDRLVFGIRVHSADRILPDLQDLAVGDKVLDSDDGDSFFTVAQLDPPRALVLLSHTHPLPPYTDVDFVWAFVLEEPAPGTTRLMMRARVHYRPVWNPHLVRALVRAFGGVGDFIQAGGMLAGIRRRAEGAPAPPPLREAERVEEVAAAA